jgi:predicted ATPase
MSFEKFNCIVGLNGAGKSTLLQGLDFVSQQMKGDISYWLKKRSWNIKDLHSKLTKAKNISIKLDIKMENELYRWESIFNTTKLRCTSEIVYNIENNEKLLKVDNLKYTIYFVNETKKISGEIVQDYEGSFLSSFIEEKLPQELIKIKNFMANITSLDLLSPQSLRQKSRSDGTELGLSGEHLTTFLNHLNKDKKEELLKQLKKCYINLYDFNIIKSRNGWKRLEITEYFENEMKVITEAKHVNDGFLRIISVLAQLFTTKDFLLFDEIENGINPELVEFLVDSLISSKHQILITTHSPMILNFIEDEEAIKSVKYIYKTKKGFTKIINFFEIPSMLKKLSVMGAGEVYVDTNLSNLYDEIISLDKEK